MVLVSLLVFLDCTYVRTASFLSEAVSYRSHMNALYAVCHRCAPSQILHFAAVQWCMILCVCYALYVTLHNGALSTLTMHATVRQNIRHVPYSTRPFNCYLNSYWPTNRAFYWRELALWALVVSAQVETCSWAQL